MDDKNLIDTLLDDELDDEVKKQIENLKLDNERLEAKNKSLKKKNERLLNGAAPSILNTYRKSNENLREKNVELNDKLKRLKRKQGSHLAHLNPQQVGVYSRMINDFQGMERNIPMTFPGVDHPIFNRFFELANKYPNRAFIVKGLNDAIQEEKDLINFEIKTQKKNIDIWLKCDRETRPFSNFRNGRRKSRIIYLIIVAYMYPRHKPKTQKFTLYFPFGGEFDGLLTR